MLPDRVSNPGPLTYESGALPFALRGPALTKEKSFLIPFTSQLHACVRAFVCACGEVNVRGA